MIGQAHAVGRKHASQRMQQDSAQAESFGNQTGMLTASRAEATQRVIQGQVMATFDRDLLDGGGHLLDSHPHESFGDLLRAQALSTAPLYLRGQGGKAGADGVDIQRLVAVGSENPREKVRLQLAQQHVGVGHAQRAAPPIAGRPGLGAGRIGSRAEAQAIVVQDRAPAGGDGVDVEHRHAQADAGDLRGLDALQFARVVSDIGGRAAHVEGDDAVEPGPSRRRHAADQTAGRAGEDAVLALEMPRLDQSAVRLHEAEHGRRPTRGRGQRAGQTLLELLDVVPQDRRQIGVDDGRIAPGNQPDAGTAVMRQGDLLEADPAGQGFQGPFMRRVAPGMHEDDCQGAIALIMGGP